MRQDKDLFLTWNRKMNQTLEVSQQSWIVNPSESYAYAKSK